MILIAVLGACATAPGTPSVSSIANLSPASSDFEVTGRLAVRNGEQGLSGLLRWLHRAPTEDDLWFSSPLGSAMARVTRSAQGVELTLTDGAVRSAANAEVLTREALGWELPLAGLDHWILGQPAPGSVPTRVERDDANGRITRLAQNGWDVVYQRYADTEWGALPDRLTLEYGELQIRLVIDRWAILR